MFYSVTIDSSNNNNHSKTLAFNRFKCFLYKCYPTFSRISRIGEHLNQFLVLKLIFEH